MHQNGITLTQRALKNLRSQVKFYLRKPIDQGLPVIERKSSIVNPIQFPITYRYSSKQKSSSKTSRKQSIHSTPKTMNTINITDDNQQNRMNIKSLKHKLDKTNKIMLPRFKKYHHSAQSNTDSNYYLQSIQSTLLQQPRDKKYQYQLQKQHNKIPYKIKSTKNDKKYRYNTKTSIDCDRLITDLDHIVTINSNNSNNSRSGYRKKQLYYGPWEMDDQHEGIADIGQY